MADAEIRKELKKTKTQLKQYEQRIKALEDEVQVQLTDVRPIISC